MALEPSSIRPLPPETQAQIRSSVVVTSLNDVIVGLLENVLDAGASSAEINLDYIKGYCSVTDNGHGIPAAEFEATGHLGSLNCTSKLDDSHPTYGRYGRFLCNLAALSLLSISSRHKSSTSTVTFHRAKTIARSSGDSDLAESIRGQHGTCIVVANLFGDIPVRYRHIVTRLQSTALAEAEFAALKKRIVALILAYGRATDIKVVDLKTRQSYKHKGYPPQRRTSFDVGAICSTLQQAGYIDQLQTTSFKLISVQTSTVCIRAAVSLDPAPSKDIQFISIGIHPVHASISTSLFLDEINAVFKSSTFGTVTENIDLQENEPDGLHKDPGFGSNRHTKRQLNSMRKCIDRWPMLYVRIDLPGIRGSTALKNGRFAAEVTDKYVEKILVLLRSMFFEFLSVHHLEPRARERRKMENLGLNRITTAGSAPSSEGNFEIITRKHATRAMSEPCPLPGYFNAWPRVKSSIMPAGYMLKSGNENEQYHFSNLLHDVSRIQTSAERVELAQNALGEVELQALDDAALELLIGDYHDETQSEKGLHSTEGAEIDDRHFEAKDAQSLDVEEATYLWTSPVTGIEHMINARNGLIVRHAKHMNTRSSVSANVGDPVQTASVLAETSMPHRMRPKPVGKTLEEVIAYLRQSDSIRSFGPGEELIPSIVPDELDDTATAQQSHSCGRYHFKTSDYFSVPANVQSHSLSKADLESAVILAQVDQKFLLVQTQPEDDSNALCVLIDQHAADERIKVEELYSQLCSGELTALVKPIIFEVPQKEIELFIRYEQHFARWQIVYHVRHRIPEEDLMTQVVVSALPALISERCRLHPTLLIDLLRHEIHSNSTSSSSNISLSAWIHRIPYCPQGLVDMIRSRACRSAVMFNDVLDRDQCEELLRKLVKCVLPFQCAHGRPSCVVLPGWVERKARSERTFEEAFTAWQVP